MEIETPKADATAEKILISSLPEGNMTRKQRRQWYRDNKKKLNLPDWGDLQDLRP